MDSTSVPDEGFRRGGVGRNPEPSKPLPKNPPQRRKCLSQSDIDALQMNYEEGREITADWAKALTEIAKDLPGFVVPRHDPNCASCTIGTAIRALAARHLGPGHRYAQALPDWER